ncbi:hypothetical protein K438DRAFT_1982347 [Mycena galopus ATCC 62051]|nr:hypothetical protein K438DRAFT_1982347 [Mycena galopus ATCC 62051]
MNNLELNLETPLAPSTATPGAAEVDLYRPFSSPNPYPSASASASASSSTSPPPLALQVLLLIPPASTRGGAAGSRSRSGWWGSLLRLRRPRPCLLPLRLQEPPLRDLQVRRERYVEDDTDVLRPTMYKNAMLLFRALFALLRILPAWRVVRKLTGRKPGGGTLLRVAYASSCGCA